MNSLNRDARVLALALTMVVSALVPTAAPAAASCLPLQVPPSDTNDTVVLVGTVVGIDGAQTELEVLEWFMGPEPTATVTIVGGRDPEIITSADWTPAIGDGYVVVATLGADGVLQTEPCQQQLVAPDLVDALHATYGEPRTTHSAPVELMNATDARVTISVSDASGTLVGAASGDPGDGASVRPYELIVTNETATSLRLTWVGGPCDSADSLTIDETGRRFLLVQPECVGDSIAHDRVLILEFAEPIDASDVEASLQDGLDTPG